jgi:hypothetical protein
MKVIKPKTISDATLLSSSVVEDDYPLWLAATTYGLGVRVLRPNHRIYESVVGSNVGNTPETTTIDDSPAAPKWLDIGASNRWRMFDTKVSTQTTGPDLSVTLEPLGSNAVGLFELVGSSARIVLTAPDTTVVYDRTLPLELSQPSDWYDYFFMEFQQTSQVVVTDLPVYHSGSLAISISGTSAACGQCIIGFASDIGALEYGATAGITDYSAKGVDVFGNATFLQRAYANRMSGKLWFNNSDLNRVHRTIASYRSTPCVWVGVEDPTYGPLTVYGWYKEFSIEVSYYKTSYCSLEIEGLV